MGSGRWADSDYSSRRLMRAASGVAAFATDAAIRSEARTTGKIKMHQSLDPKGVVRESRDSADNPNSRAVAVLLDVTGSMRKVPEIIQQTLPGLMNGLNAADCLGDPHVLVGAIGDYECDNVPLQIGQFEADIRVENDLTNFFMEGGGGANGYETYGLAMHFIGTRTSIDCFEKRGQKGYLFIIGDEPCERFVSGRDGIEKILGKHPNNQGDFADVPIDRVVAKLKEQWEVFFVIPNMTSHYNSVTMRNGWKELIGGQNVILLENPEHIVTLIANTIRLCERGTALPRASGDDFVIIRDPADMLGTSAA